MRRDRLHAKTSRGWSLEADDAPFPIVLVSFDAILSIGVFGVAVGSHPVSESVRLWRGESALGPVLTRENEQYTRRRYYSIAPAESYLFASLAQEQGGEEA